MTWKVVANSWQYTSIYGADGKRLFLMDLEDWGVTEENQDALEKQQADIARLASASPDMLEALLAADLALTHGGKHEGTLLLMGIRAAIATAMGK